MRLKNWLLTGTSIGLLALAPLSANAQDGDLRAAYEAYAAAQASGDAAALEAAQGALTELCIVAGYTSLDECIAAINGGAPAPALEEAPPAEEIQPEAPVEEPQPEAPAEQPPAEAPPAEQPSEPQPEAPVEQPAEPAPEAPVEEPAPQPEAPVEQPAAESPVEAQPAPEAPAPVEVAPEAAPAPEAPPAPAAEAAPPAEQPAAPAAPAADYGALLGAQVEAYNGAVADLMAGNDPAGAQARIDAARAEIARLCAEAGLGDEQTCLANFGLQLPAIPALPTAPAPEQPAAPAPAPADAQPPAAGEQPPPPAPGEQLLTPEGAPAEIIPDLPEGITQEQVAPVLDSAKDDAAPPPPAVEGAPAAPAPEGAPVAPAAPAQPEAPPPPPPTSDFEAQTLIAPAEAQIVSVTAEEGQVFEVTGAPAAPTALPPNVTIVNQTNVVNNVTNNTTNVDNSTTNIGQQNNVQQNNVQPPAVQPLGPGEAITQVIFQVGSQLVVNSIGQDTDRFYNAQQDEVFYENLRNGRVRETITRPDGSKVITVRNANGDILRRSRITPDGQEVVLAYFDERYDTDLLEWRDPGANLPPLRLNIPVRDYVLDAEFADEDELEVFFRQPPVEQVARIYSIDEVKRSARVRDSVRRLEVGNLTFDTGAATIGRDQVGALSGVANAMLGLLQQNPAETFLIEGHTDAVGSDVSNLGLSDLRAATVARILTDFYGVPPENLATQGYGERYLKIRTEAAERENRRVTIRRITPLITLASN